jgi:peptide/nickel transport system substrate-binding protein
VALALLPALLLPALAGCGRGGGGTPPGPREGDPRRGGTLVALMRAPELAPDPHRVTSPAQAMVHAALYRTPYAWRPGDDARPTPDLADGPPEVSEDRRRVRVRLRPGVRFGPHGERDLVAADVEHGIERALGDPVTGPRARRWLGALVGLSRRAEGWRDVRGVRAEDDRTLVLRLRRPQGMLAAAALATPLATPVPAELSRRGGALPSRAGLHTGPYVPVARPERPPAGAPAGTVVLERNPRFSLGAARRPAFAERIELEPAPAGARTASRVLEGRGLLLAEGPVPESIARRAGRRGRAQLERVPLPVTRYVALNALVAPFGRADVRRAVLAAVDRQALRRAAGGVGATALASHWLPPGVPGYDESGGAEGPRTDYLAAPRGDLALARSYLRRAGLESGRYSGAPLDALAADTAAERALARSVRDALAPLGLRLRLRFAPVAEVRERCASPRSRVAICPGARLGAIVGEPEALLRAGFEPGPPSDANWAHLPASGLRAAMAQAGRLAPGEERAAAWGAVNRGIVGLAPGVPWGWDEVALLAARDVRAVANEHLGGWDLASSALEEDPKR